MLLSKVLSIWIVMLILCPVHSHYNQLADPESPPKAYPQQDRAKFNKWFPIQDEVVNADSAFIILIILLVSQNGQVGRGSQDGLGGQGNEGGLLVNGDMVWSILALSGLVLKDSQDHLVSEYLGFHRSSDDSLIPIYHIHRHSDIYSWSFCYFSALISELMLYFILQALSIQTDPYQGLIFIYAIICMNIFIHMIAYMPICIGEMWDVTTVHERTKKVESGAVFSFGRIQGRGGRGYKTIFLAQTEIKNPQNF